MKNSLTNFICSTLFIIVLFLFPIGVPASQIDHVSQQKESGEIFEVPKKMTENDLNELFGEDPYLGQTSYLQFPDGFNERKNKNK